MIVPAWLRHVGTELGAAFGKKVAVCAKKMTVLGFLLLLCRFLEVCSIIEVSFKSFSDAFWPLGPVLAALIIFKFLFGFYRWATLQERVLSCLRAMPDAERRRIDVDRALMLNRGDNRDI